MDQTLVKSSPTEEKDFINIHRRKFLSSLGLSAAGIALVTTTAGCSKDNDDPDAVNLGSGDFGVLNYAYALEQLEAAFYTQAVNSLYSGITPAEQSYLTDIRDHEIAHREFFKAVLGNNAIPALEVNFSSVNFGSRDSVLATAKAFEDLGVSAYNGAGKLLADANYLLLAGKIVSVEARHAALIRDLISNGSFADSTVINAQGLDISRSPSEVLAIAAPYIRAKINASNLPTS